jgi:hypothetical protein
LDELERRAEAHDERFNHYIRAIRQWMEPPALEGRGDVPVPPAFLPKPEHGGVALMPGQSIDAAGSYQHHLQNGLRRAGFAAQRIKIFTNKTFSHTRLKWVAHRVSVGRNAFGADVL